MVKKHLTEFETEQAYEAFVQSAAFERPNVSLIAETGEVAFEATVQDIPVESIQITNIPYDGQYGSVPAQHQFGIVITPENATNKNISWEVSAADTYFNDYLTIDNTGLLSFLRNNMSTTITVTATSSNGRTDSCSFLISYSK